MNRQRISFWSILITVPIVVLLGWFVTERRPTWFPETPGFLRPTGANPATGACEALAAVDAYDGRFIRFAYPTDILQPDAAAPAREHVEATLGITLDGPDRLSRPTLVQATFPEIGERYAWLVIATLPRDGARFDRVAVVFVDADSGELLALHSAVAVEDAASACGGGPLSRRELLRQYAPLLLAGAYVGLVALGLGIRRWWTRRRPR